MDEEIERTKSNLISLAIIKTKKKSKLLDLDRETKIVVNKDNDCFFTNPEKKNQ